MKYIVYAICYVSMFFILILISIGAISWNFELDPVIYEEENPPYIDEEVRLKELWTRYFNFRLFRKNK